MNKIPRFPLYIPSKGRSQYMVTSKALTKMGVEHYIVVEKQDLESYQEAIDRLNLSATLLELDLSYKEKYELCDDLGMSRSTGPGPARNFIWEHSISKGHEWHWTMDDNIRSFMRLHNNMRVRVFNGALFRAMEDFCTRYDNVSMAGPNYTMFAPDRKKHPPFVINTRIYSCNLIRNDVPFRWRGRYNEDTILSLDMLKAGWCTVQFYAFLQEKMPTQVLKGGNTDEFYHVEGKVREGQNYADTGTLAKSQMQVDVHPDVSKLVWRFSRWHHYVDYSSFKNNRLRRKKDYNYSEKTDNYGMEFKDNGA